MTSQTREAIELLADEDFNGPSRWMGSRPSREIFVAGAEALDKLYSEGVEFDEKAATTRAWNVFGFDGPQYIEPNTGAICVTKYMIAQSRWQFEQMKARVGAAELAVKGLKIMNEKCRERDAKIKDLEAQLAEAQKRFRTKWRLK